MEADYNIILIFLTNLMTASVCAGMGSYAGLCCSGRMTPWIQGVIFGLSAILTMEVAIPVTAGAFVDFRVIIMTLAGYTGGALSAFLAALIGIIYRLYHGGCGTIAGVIVIAVFALFGYYLRRVYSYDVISKPRNLLRVSIAITILYTAIVFGVNTEVYSYDITIAAMNPVLVPLFLLLPVGTFIGFFAFFAAYRTSFYTTITKTILKNTQFDIAAFNDKGKIIFSSDRLRNDKFLINVLEREANLFSTVAEGQKLTFIKNVDSEGGVTRTFSINASSADMPQLKLGAVAVIDDITDSKRKMAELDASNDRFAKLFNACFNQIVIADRMSRRFCFVNEVCLRNLGWTSQEIIGNTPEELNFWVNETDRWQIDKLMDEKKYVRDYELAYRTKTGAIRVGMLSIELITVDGTNALLGILDDISKRKKLEKEIARLDRLNIIGQMAANIGHEVRNPMTTVKGFLQLLRQKNCNQKDDEYYDIMIKELDHANQIITEFLALAKNKLVEKKLCNLNDIIRVIVPLLEANALMLHMTVRTDLANIPDMMLDEKEMRQLVLNLCQNGLEAMSDGGILTLSTFQSGNKVVLIIEDQGTGIEPQVLADIGMPFLTTKDNATGLGLPVCYSIAARHDAGIEINTSQYGTSLAVVFYNFADRQEESVKIS